MSTARSARIGAPLLAGPLFSPFKRAADSATQTVNKLRFARTWLTAVKHPERLDEIVAMADRLSNDDDLDVMHALITADADARAGMASRVRTGPIDIAELARLPEGTVGHGYATFLTTHGLDPNDLPHREAGTDHEWLQAHLFETHDIWHVITGFNPDIAGEMGLQAFYLAQIRLPLAMAILGGGFMNALLHDRDDVAPRMDAITQGWQMGKRAKLLMGVDWTAQWQRPLSDFQAEFGVQA